MWGKFFEIEGLMGREGESNWGSSCDGRLEMS